MPNKVLQLDALSLDIELLKTLNSKLSVAFGDSKLPISIQKFGTRFSLELELILKLLLFKSTIWNKGNTYGLRLQNLTLHDSGAPYRQNISKLRKLSLLSSIVGSYLYSRFEKQLYSSELELNAPNLTERSLIKSLGKLVRQLNKYYAIFSLANFVTFLLNGKFPSLMDRILKVSYIPISNTEVSLASNPEAISYEFQDRQLVWNTLTEFLAFTLPLISIKRLWISLKSIFHINKYTKKTMIDGSNNIHCFLPQACCAICYKKSSENLHNGEDVSIEDNLITNPYITNCGHLYCYYCIINKLDDYNELNGGVLVDKVSDDGTHWNCLRCGMPVLFCKPYDGDCQQFIPRVSSTMMDDNELESSDDGEVSNFNESDDEGNNQSMDNIESKRSNVDDYENFEDSEV